MLEFVLKNKCFEFNGKVKQQLSDMAICTKCAPPYACVFMDKVEAVFFKSQKQKPVVQFRYFDDIFIWTRGKELRMSRERKIFHSWI